MKDSVTELGPIASQQEGEGIPFPILFAECPAQVTLPPGVTAWCETKYTTVEATGLKTDVSGSDED